MITFTDSDGKPMFALVDSDGHVQADVLSIPTVTVTATDLDIRNLAQAQDNVKIGDGTRFISLTADSELKVRLTYSGINIPVNQQGYTFNDTNYGLNVQAGLYVSSSNPDGASQFRPLHCTASGSTYSLDVHLTDATLAVTQSGTWNIGTVTTVTTVATVTTLTSITNDVSIDDGGNTITIDGTVGVTDATPTTLANNQVAIDTTADLILAGSASTRSVLIKNIGAQSVYIGTSAVTSANGYKLAANAAVGIDTEAAIYGICAAGESSTVCYLALT
jgi:hypothetical protein